MIAFDKRSETEMSTSGIKKILSVITAFGLAAALIPCFGTTAYAADEYGEAIERLKNTPWYRPKDSFAVNIYADEDSSGLLKLAEQSYPSSFDLRDEGVISPVRVQHPFGSCWAFSLGVAVESSLISSGLASGDIDYSEKHLLNYLFQTDHGFDEDDPHSQNGEGYFHNIDPDSSGRMNLGGFSFYGTSLFSQGIGPVFESEDEELEYHGRYKNISYRITDPDLPFSYSRDDDWNIDLDDYDHQSYSLKESFMLPTPHDAYKDYIYYSGLDPDCTEAMESWERYTRANDTIKDQLINGRAVSVGICADSTLPSQEKLSGFARYLNMENWAGYCYEESESNHSVAIVGWDDN